MRRASLVALVAMACAAPPPASQTLRPIVIAHRGACAERPEHTLEAYRLAIEQGADFIEIDIVATSDGHLVARHENELSRSTDVETRPHFANRRTTKRVQGSVVTGWFSEDFTLREIKMLRAIERMPEDRPESALHDGRYEVATLEEIVALLQRVERESGRRVGLDVELKAATWFGKEGTRLGGEPIALSLPQRLVDVLVALEFTHPERVFIQAFEVEPLLDLQRTILPAAGFDLPLLQLLGNPGDPSEPFQAPYDFRYNARQGLTPYGALARCLAQPIDATGYGHLTTRNGLRCLKAHYAEGLSARKENVLLREPTPTPVDVDGDTVAAARTQLIGDTPGWVEDARALGLVVHYWTLRAEERFRTLGRDGEVQSVEAEAHALLQLGADGLITDHPRSIVAARDAFLAAASE